MLINRHICKHLTNVIIKLGILFIVVDTEGSILQFLLHMPHTKTIGERGKDVEDRYGKSFFFFVRQRSVGSKVMQAIGEFDYHSHRIPLEYYNCPRGP